MNNTYIDKAWTPLKTTWSENQVSLSVLGREYRIDNNLLFSSVTSKGKEILSSPIKVVMKENGKDTVFSSPTVFVLSNNDQEAKICATAQGRKFIVNTAIKMSYDGFAQIDLKVMPIGRTVNQVFGLEGDNDLAYSLDRLWIDIPFSKGVAKYFHIHPTFLKEQNPIYEGEQIEYNNVCMSRHVKSSMKMDFKSIAYFGNDEIGLSYVCESAENWQYENNVAMELINQEDGAILRLHLLDSHPKQWKDVDNPQFLRNYGYLPICFRFGLQALPIKNLDSNLLKENSVHIDCFKKVKSNYFEFLLEESVDPNYKCNLDRIKAKGVTLLYLHEKWNRIQNYWEVSKNDELKIKTIIDECHKRGIKVIPYFGYEISTLLPQFLDWHDEVMQKDINEHHVNRGGWYRVPYQRDYIACYKSSWKEKMLSGVDKLFDEYHFDGIYLDTMLLPMRCNNSEHGCGFTDINGKIHETYPVFAVREFMMEMNRIIHKHKGIVSCHCSNCLNLPSMGFADLIWDGEAIQQFLHEEGIDQIKLDYMDAEYNWKLYGISYEFLIYTFDNWSYKDGLCLSLLYGMFPKPNDIEAPLDIMSDIWKIYDEFGAREAKFIHYFENKLGIVSSNNLVKVSGYVEPKNNKYKKMIIVSNPSSKDAETTLSFDDCSTSAYDPFEKKTFVINNKYIDIHLEKCGFKILLLK